MSGIPIQKRTEYCLYVLATADPMQDAFLRFTPTRGAIKCDMKKTVAILEDEGRWWFAFQKPWDHQTAPFPSKFLTLFGSRKNVDIRIRSTFNNWKNVQVSPLIITPSQFQRKVCTICDGSGKYVIFYSPDFPIEQMCTECHGVGETEVDQREESKSRDRFPFIATGALDHVKATKTIEEYDRFILRLEDEQTQRREKEERRNPRRGKNPRHHSNNTA